MMLTLWGLSIIKKKEQLHVFRKVYRNPYSHANLQQIFPDMPLSLRLVHIDEIEREGISKLFASPNAAVNPQDFLPVQGILQVFKAEDCAKDYFLKVDEIIRRITKRLYDKGN